MAPQRNKRSTKRVKDDDDDDFDPTQNTALLTKLFTAGQDQKSKRANQSFRSEGRAVLDDVAKELERAVEAYQGKQDAFEASVIATQRSLEETPSWTPLIVKAMSTAKDSMHDLSQLTRSQAEEYAADQDPYDAECTEMIERHKLDLARQGRKVKKLTKQTLAEQEEVEQLTETCAREFARLFKRAVRL